MLIVFVCSSVLSFLFGWVGVGLVLLLASLCLVWVLVAGLVVVLAHGRLEGLLAGHAFQLAFSISMVMLHNTDVRHDQRLRGRGAASKKRYR